MYSAYDGTDSYLGGSSESSPFGTVRESSASVAPNFLFGSQRRRRSPALQSESYGGGNGVRDDVCVFASPIPEDVDTTISSSKSVHWSLALSSSKSVVPSSAVPLSTSPSQSRGPPRRSLLEELKQGSNPAICDVDCTMESDIITSSDPIYQQQPGLWVTVFGFPPRDASLVLKLFGRHGTVEAHQFADNGNWLYLRYATAVHAQQALSRNAQIFDGRLRLGVILTSAQEVANLRNASRLDKCSRVRSRKNSQRPRESFPATFCEADDLDSTVEDISDIDGADALETFFRPTRLASTPRAGIRSLIAAYNAADNEYRVDSVPQTERSTGLLEKVWSLIS